MEWNLLNLSFLQRWLSRTMAAFPIQSIHCRRNLFSFYWQQISYNARTLDRLLKKITFANNPNKYVSNPVPLMKQSFLKVLLMSCLLCIKKLLVKLLFRSRKHISHFRFAIVVFLRHNFIRETLDGIYRRSFDDPLGLKYILTCI